MRHCAVIATAPAALAGVTVVVHRQTDDAILIAYWWFGRLVTRRNRSTRGQPDAGLEWLVRQRRQPRLLDREVHADGLLPGADAPSVVGGVLADVVAVAAGLRIRAPGWRVAGVSGVVSRCSGGRPLAR
ncbi:MAG: hypothetical protein ACR2MP_11510 [Streptosporangiaceae bacterium]